MLINFTTSYFKISTAKSDNRSFSAIFQGNDHVNSSQIKQAKLHQAQRILFNCARKYDKQSAEKYNDRSFKLSLRNFQVNTQKSLRRSTETNYERRNDNIIGKHSSGVKKE